MIFITIIIISSSSSSSSSMYIHIAQNRAKQLMR